MINITITIIRLLSTTSLTASNTISDNSVQRHLSEDLLIAIGLAQERNKGVIFLTEISSCKFIERKNRFLGVVALDGQETEVFIPNPGRMNELMVKGKKMYIEKRESVKRKTDYNMIAVEHQGILISIDSNKPNRFIKRMLENRRLKHFDNYTSIKSEPAYHSGRFDFKLDGKVETLIEVKSCTLVEGSRAIFPDAPTKRGARHVLHLADALTDGLIDDAAVVFVVQRPDAEVFSPNWRTDPDFSKALEDAFTKGVRIIALRTELQDWRLELLDEIPVQLAFAKHTL